MDELTAARNIRTFIRTILAMPANSVRPANQQGPADNVAEYFATVLVTAVENPGWDQVVLSNEPDPSTNVTETLTGLRHFTASVQFFRGDAYGLATKLQAVCRSATATDLAVSFNLGITTCGIATNLTALVNTFYESRAQLDLGFYAVSQETSSLATYESFPITIQEN